MLAWPAWLAACLPACALACLLLAVVCRVFRIASILALVRLSSHITYALFASSVVWIEKQEAADKPCRLWSVRVARCARAELHSSLLPTCSLPSPRLAPLNMESSLPTSHYSRKECIVRYEHRSELGSSMALVLQGSLAARTQLHASSTLGTVPLSRSSYI